MHSITGLSASLPMSVYLNQIRPWVTVICTCYNQDRFVAAALQSVADQDYPNVELIVIDNASQDQSANYIDAFRSQYPATQFIRNETNVGLNRAFNQGLARAGGRYVIDLAADDLLLPNRISQQVALFEKLAGPYAVVFSNATYIDEQGNRLHQHYPTDSLGRSAVRVPSGNVFQQVLESYFICTPTMMMRRDVLNELGGYDENLAFEDFDFWVRSSRQYLYAYQDEVLTLKRRVGNSLSAQVALPTNQLLQSSLVVCQKALPQCVTSVERHALANRIRRFTRKAFYAEQFDLAQQFGQLLRRLEQPDLLTRLVLRLSWLNIPVNRLYRQYLQLQQKV
jgi:glycosyltransferase involved in cell wall biosynthesis